MSALRQAMPHFSRHEGVWEGIYRHYDADGRLADQHRSRLVCRIPDGGPHDYLQTNHYTWDDGRTERREFPGQYRAGRLWFDNELISGWAAEDPLDEHHRTMLLHWLRKGDPGLYLYEMIQLSDCGRFRTRVWQWIRDGRCAMRTLIDESKVSDRWDGL